MRTFAEPPFGIITVGAEELQPLLGPALSLEALVKSAAESLTILFPAAVNVIDSEEVPISLPAANAFPPVGRDHLLSNSHIRLFYFVIRRCRAFLAEFLILLRWAGTTLRATPFFRQPYATACRRSPAIFSAAFTLFGLCITRAAAARTTALLCVTLIGMEIGLLFHVYIIPQYMYAKQGG